MCADQYIDLFFVNIRIKFENMAKNAHRSEVVSSKIDGDEGGTMDEVDGVTEKVTKIEEYLRQLIVWGRTLLIAILAISLIAILIYNFFAPAEKDVSSTVINKLLSALNQEIPIDFIPKIRNQTG